MSWSKRRPRGERSTTASRAAGDSARIAWTARKKGSGFITIPGPPPNGASATERWRSSVRSRRSWTRRSTRPRSRARWTIPPASGPSTMAGKIVTTSIRNDVLRPEDDDAPAGEVHGLHEGLGEGHEGLAARPPHHEDPRLGAGLHHLVHRAHVDALLVDGPQPHELVVVEGPRGQDGELLLGDAQLGSPQ